MANHTCIGMPHGRMLVVGQPWHRHLHMQQIRTPAEHHDGHDAENYDDYTINRQNRQYNISCGKNVVFPGTWEVHVGVRTKFPVHLNTFPASVVHSRPISAICSHLFDILLHIMCVPGPRPWCTKKSLVTQGQVLGTPRTTPWHTKD